jgi:23S rRNA G2445 N2-methylase RlmL
VKDAVADRFRAKSGVRPDVNTQWPDVRIHLHLTDEATVYIDTSGEPLFKRGWREDKGDALKKLAAAMIAASGWDTWRARAVVRPLLRQRHRGHRGRRRWPAAFARPASAFCL